VGGGWVSRTVGESIRFLEREFAAGVWWGGVGWGGGKMKRRRKRRDARENVEK
jgi:hypothetical protein